MTVQGWEEHSEGLRCQEEGRTPGQLEKRVWGSGERSGLEAETGVSSCGDGGGSH